MTSMSAPRRQLQKKKKIDAAPTPGRWSKPSNCSRASALPVGNGGGGEFEAALLARRSAASPPPIFIQQVLIIITLDI
jgi:hypothetical protein